jgi:DNA repair protein RadC
MSDRDTSVHDAVPLQHPYIIPNPRVVPRRFTTGAKIRKFGARNLTNIELLAVLIGDSRGDAADKLIRGRGLKGLACLSDADILKVRGVGPSHLNTIRSAFELHRRLSGYEPAVRPRIMKAADVYAQVPEIRRAQKEHLVGLYLDAQNGLITRETLTMGSLNTTRAHPREILWPAINHLAVGFILAHNHPSGGLEPSPEDVAFTRGVQRAGEVVGIELFDHVIVTADGFTSLRERGAL